MHLCETCQKMRDWDRDTTVQWQIKENLARDSTHPAKARCAECTQPGSGAPTFVKNPMFQICRHCAERLQKCQHCLASTLRSPELAALEAFETLFDAFVTLVKTYGLSTACNLLSKAALSPDEAVHAPALLALGTHDIDSSQRQQKYYYRLGRPIWTKVWGPLSFRTTSPRCAACAPPPRGAPEMVRAALCGHWTAGATAAWCLPCAVEQRACAVCEASTE